MSDQTPSTRLRRISARLGLEQDWYLLLIAAGIGILMGAVATAFIMPLRFVEELVESHSDDGSGGWLQYAVLIGPAIGGLLAGWVTCLIRSENHGPGVTGVMYAVHRAKSQVPLKFGIRKWLASTLTIGSGGSAGAEGPIVTIGATIGSGLGRWLHTNPQNTATLLGCGAAAGISAIFNAPFAGIFFCLEILLRDFSLRTFTPIVIASVISALWMQTMLGPSDPLFPVPLDFFAKDEYITLNELPNFFILGVACGLFAPLFIRMLSVSDSLFGRIKVHDAFRPAIGGLILGVIGLVYVLIKHPDDLLLPFYGNGYPVIHGLLDPTQYFSNVETKLLHPLAGAVFALLLIVILKAVSTSLTIGSRGAGGMFAPALLMGAGIGGAVGMVMSHLGLMPGLNPAHYALVGMAAMIGSTTHAPLTGIIIVYEITKSEKILLALMFATVISTLVSRLVARDSVYSWKLTQMGVQIGELSDRTILRRISVGDVPLVDAVVIRPNDSAQLLLDWSERRHVEDFVVAEEGKYIGMVVGADVRMAMLEREAIPLLLVSELLRKDLPTVTPGETLDSVLDKFSRFDMHSLAVLDPRAESEVQGVITRDRLMRRYQEAIVEAE